MRIATARPQQEIIARRLPLAVKRRCLAGDLVLVLILSLALRWFYAAGITFPPPDDPAYYVTVARNLYAGRGFTSDVIWQYQVAFASPTHPAGDLWMPLASWLIYLSFLVFGPSWPAAQLPGILAGAALPALTYLLGRQVFAGRPGERGLSLAAALLVSANGLLAYQSASADSAAPFALVTATALWLMGRRPGTLQIAPAGLPNPAERERGGFSLEGMLRDGNPPRTNHHLSLAVGALIGLSYLTRSEGLWLYLAFVLLAAYRRLKRSPFARDRVATQNAPPDLTIWRERLNSYLLVTFSFLVVVAPWLLRNFLALGTPFPAPTLRLALLTQYADLFNYATPITWERWWSQGLPALLTVRTEALWHNWHGVLDSLFFPTALLPLAGLWRLRHRADLAPAIWFGALLFLVTALVFPVPTLAGTFYHNVGSLAPCLAVAAVYALQQGLMVLARWRNWRSDFFWLAYAALLAVTLAQFSLTYAVTGQEHRRQEQQLTQAAAWLADHPGSVLMSTQPFNLNYLTGRPALMLPAGEELSVVRELARRYNARYLVINQEFGLYPQRLRAETTFSSLGEGMGFRLAYRTAEVEIYAIE